ncbi:hypothetical protein GGX14DRAFT_455273 [Mycena pura]|uniref:DUF6535 domain-containing protein n=1 Tax=Mycena pura TaxID=153505 RepID=A0AAD6YDY2_9AGAR|nr:hypothetical protein GGX14DRAFT_455273 [Mycena pura]
MEKYPPQRPVPVVDTPGDEPCAQIWTVYISEAEKYDKALVDSWRGNMNGLLIFAGLFSAVLTTFIIESYKLLDSTIDQNTLVLLHVSQQLANPGTPAFTLTDFNHPPNGPLPPLSAFVCNILWFISLGLSLSSALTATLVDQWAREFLQRTEMNPSPVKRARIYAYLYYGLKRFRMHAIVGVIPLLLHLSLIFFLAGLVAFLHPVSTGVAILAGVLAATVTLVYAAMTIFPLLRFDCPYKTPLSSILWSLRRWIARRLVQRHRLKQSTAVESPHLHSMNAAMVETATVRSDPREERDQRALVWTMRSLADDDELEPFVEGIPNAIWGPQGRRRKYDNLILGLLEDPMVLGARIEHLMLSCETGLLAPMVKTRRELSCLKAIWYLGMMAEMGERKQIPAPGQPAWEMPRLPTTKQPLSFFPGLRLQGQRFLPAPSPTTAPYLPSIKALIDWNDLCAMHGHVDALVDLLEANQCELEVGRLADMARCYRDLNEFLNAYRHYTWQHVIPIAFGAPVNLEDLAKWAMPLTLHDMTDWIRQVLQIVQNIPTCWNKVQYRILHSFLRESAVLMSAPYEFEQTCQTIQPSEREPFDMDMVGNVMATFADNVRRAVESKSAGVTHVDTILGILLPWFDTNRQLEADVTNRITDGVIEYVNNRGQNDALGRVLRNCDMTRVWEHVAGRLETCRPEAKGEVSKAMWHLAAIFPRRSMPNPHQLKHPKFNAGTLSVVPTAPYAASVAALLKTHILDAYEAAYAAKDIQMNLQRLETQIKAHERPTVSEELKAAVRGIEADWALMSAVCGLVLPLPTLRRPLQALPPFPPHTILTIQAYREWRVDALAAIQNAVELAPRLDRRMEEARLAITAEFVQSAGDSNGALPLPYQALETLRDNLLPVLYVSQAAHPTTQRAFVEGLRELVEVQGDGAERVQLVQAVVMSSLFMDPGLPWLSDALALRTLEDALRTHQAVFAEHGSVLLGRKVEEILNWLEQKVPALEALNHQGSDPGPPRPPLSPIQQTPVQQENEAGPSRPRNQDSPRVIDSGPSKLPNFDWLRGPSNLARTRF